MKIDASAYRDWAKKGRWSGWCFTSRIGPKVCVCACFPAGSVFPCWIWTWTAATFFFFPKPKCLCGFCISHPHAPDLLTMSPAGLSVIRPKDRWSHILDNQSPRPFPQLLWDSWFLLGSCFSCSITLPISPSPARISRVHILRGVKQMHWNTRSGVIFSRARDVNASGTVHQSPQHDLVSHSDTELSYCRGSLQAKVEAADQGSSPAG